MRLFLLTVFIGGVISCHSQSDSQITNIESSTNKTPKPKHISYCWLEEDAYSEPLKDRYRLLNGYSWVETSNNSFQEWLLHLPMEPKGTKIKLFNGKKKRFQLLNAGVVKIDVGNRDLQQCADACIRLRAEYLYSTKQYNKIHFNYTSGFKAEYEKWRAGNKISVKGNKVSYFNKPSSMDMKYEGFKKYLTNVYNYAGTYSLNKELEVKKIDDLAAGDVFIIGGFPGHVIIVLGVSQNSKGDKAVLLGQSYMPAQSIHVIRNQNKPTKGAWFLVEDLKKNGWSTLEWSYGVEHLKTWTE